MSNERDVNFPAMFTMHTPNGPTHACDEHAKRILTLCRFMGWHANAAPAPEGAQCENCANEAKATKEPKP